MHMDPNSCISRFSLESFNCLRPSKQHEGVTSFRLFLLVAGVLILSVGQPTLNAQDIASPASQNYYQDQPYSPSQQVLRPIQPVSATQLEQLVAPIALYPDALVAQILAASTYSQQVAEADQWRHEMANASAEQIAAEADAQPWDPSVKALTAFPQVLAQMDRNLRWTTDLGNAYYNQPEDVLEAVQVMRRRAEEAGNLQSTPQEVVRNDQGYIALAPANPQIVYVPTYNPWTVYGDPIAPYPGFSLLGALGEIFGATPLRYGLGIVMSAFTNTPWGWLSWGLNWLTNALLFDHSDYYSHSNTVADWGFRHTGFHAYAGHGGFGRSGFARAGVRGEGWRRGGGNGGGWRSFERGNSFAGNARGGWNSFDRGNAGNWRRGSEGFQDFRGSHSVNGAYGRGFNDRFGGGHTAYAANFNHATAGNLRESRFGTWSGARPSSSHFGSYGSSKGSRGRSGNSGSQHWFSGGHSQKSFGRTSWGGGRSGGGGHAPKGFGGGKSFGGGHSRGGGHSGGHGGSSKHHR